MDHVQIDVAQVLLEIEAVRLTPREPVTFKSGLKSPVYVDNRKLPYWPAQWQKVIHGFQKAINDRQITFDILAGIETAGIPHSSALAYVLQKPSVFVRKQAKEHGTKSRIEGGPVAGKQVLLIEDLVTTGSSSLAGVEALREEDAVVEDCLAIISYGFDEAQQQFEKAGVRLHTLTSFAAVVELAAKSGRFTQAELGIIDDWVHNPQDWARRQGFES